MCLSYMNKSVKLQQKEMWKSRAIAMGFALLIVLLFLSPSALALDLNEETVKLLDDFKGEINKVYDFVVAVIRPIATVLLAGYAIACLLGTQKDVEKNVGKIKFIVLALIAIWLLPTFFHWMLSLSTTNFGGVGGLPAPKTTFPPIPTPTS